ncbi:MAG: rod shape-determining protein MreC [Victivallales bacterium]|nr:rod shape-determining protein MreC [Victivallales bacterium]
MPNKKIVYILLILSILILLSIQYTRRAVYRIAGDFFYPFVSMVYNIESYVDKKSGLRKSKAALIDEIEKLKKENLVVSAKAETVDLLRRENYELHQLLKLKSNPFYKYIFSEIISRDPIMWFQEFTINKGSNSGIETGALVIARIKDTKNRKNIRFGVVGRISAVSNHTAVVDTIINKDCRLSVVIPENGATGILKGGGRNGSQLWSEIGYLPRDLIYRVDSIVETSGLNSFTPPALNVGRILGNGEAVVKVYNDLYKKAKIKPTVDFNHLKFVLVLVKND